MKLESYSIGELCKISAGGDAPKMLSPLRTKEYNVPVFSNGVVNEGLYGYTTDPIINEPAVTIAARGTIGAAFYRAMPYVPIVRLLSLIPKDERLSVEYLYYCLSRRNYNVGASVQAQLTVPMISNMEIQIPERNIQDAIASVLSSLDRKISLNRKANEVLESMAKQLYDYWFVQFDFPNAEGKPYKSSGGKMVYNETLKREIPEGWEDCTLRYYIKRITNGLNPRKNFVLGMGNNYYVTIKSLTGTDIDWENCDRCDDEALSKINSRSDLQVGDIIFSAIGTIGKTYRIFEEPCNWNISETSFTIRRADGIPEDFFYSLLRCDEIQIKADKAAVGSTMRCLVMDPLCDVLYFKIPQNAMELYSEVVRSYYLRIYQNNKETLRLTSLRDYLLPLLMNGQVKVL